MAVRQTMAEGEYSVRFDGKSFALFGEPISGTPAPQ
jgi:hypothetical protein